MGVLAKPIPFGDYFLLEKVNTGGMAEVFKAKTFGVEGFERIVAVKKILPSIAEDEEFITMFIDEAKIAGQLNHANIVQIFDLGNIKGDYYIAMEYVSGHDLRVIFDRCIRTGRKLDIACVCYIISKICEGLDYAHNKKDANGNPMNIIHRDISPQNILIGYDGECKLIDFGIAKASTKSSATQVGILKGKFSYMSPEQVSGKANLDRRSDIFALGIVLFELLTLKRLFLGSSDFETLEKIRKVEVTPPTLYNPDIPEDLEEIVLKALEKDVNARYQTAGEMQEALQRFMFEHKIYFTAKDLKEFCHQTFAQEIALEQKKLEFYKDLTRDILMQSKKPSEDAEDETLFYEKQNMPKMSGVQYEISGKDLAQAAAPKQAIYDELDDFEPPTGDIVYSKKSKPAAEPAAADEQKVSGQQKRSEKYSDIIGSPVKPARLAAARRAVVPQNDVAVNKGNETMMAPAIEQKKNPARTVFIIIVILLVGASCIVLYYWYQHNYDARNGQLTFNINPPDVKVRVEIDGQIKNQEPAIGPIQIKDLSVRNKVNYRVTAEGYAPAESSIQPNANPNAVDIMLQPIKQTMLELTVNTEGAIVFVDGEQLQSPENNGHYELTGITPGQHSIKIIKEGYKPEESVIDIPNGQQLSKIFKLTPATAVLVLRTDPYPAKYKVSNHQSGVIVSEGMATKEGIEIGNLSTDEEFDIVVYDGDKEIKQTWKSKSDAVADEKQFLPIKTEFDPNAAAVAQVAQPAEPAPQQNTAGTGTAVAKAPTVTPKPQQPKKPKETEPAPPKVNNNVPCAVKINSKPKAEKVFINGKEYKGLPLSLELPPGVYTVRFVDEGKGIDNQQTIKVVAGDDSKNRFLIDLH